VINKQLNGVAMEYPLYGQFDYRIKRFFKKLGIIIITSPLVALILLFPAWIIRAILGERVSLFFPLWCVTLLVECLIFIMKYSFGPYLWLKDDGLYVARGRYRILIPWTDVRSVEEYLHDDQRGIRLTFDEVPLWKTKSGSWESSGSFSFDYCYDITSTCGANYWRGDEPADYDTTYEEECECDSREEHIRAGMPYYLFIPDIFSTPLDIIYQRMIGLWRT
jgi:hypothetical protein